MSGPLPEVAERELEPVSINVPDDILSLIAEKLIDEYELIWQPPSWKCPSWNITDWYGPTSLATRQTEPLQMVHVKSRNSLIPATTCKTFEKGIRQGLRASFNGALTIVSGVTADDIDEYAKRHKLKQVISDVILIVIDMEMGVPLTQVNYSPYAKLKTIEIEMAFHYCDTVENGGEMKKKEFDAEAVRSALSAKPDVRALKDTSLEKKLKDGLRMVVVWSYQWQEGCTWEITMAEIDMFKDKPVVTKKKTRKSGG